MGVKRRPSGRSIIFGDFDASSFWKDSDYARKTYVCAPPTAAEIQRVETELGVRLPSSYIELMKVQNGGIPRDVCFPTEVDTSWAEDHVAISGIFGIGRDRRYSLCGEAGSPFWIDHWEYPDIGICICDCPSGGHDMIMLDYRKNGRQGEPEVVHVDQGRDFEITFLAATFEAFVRGLVNDSVYDTSAEDLKDDLTRIDSGSFSSQLSRFIGVFAEIDLGPVIRKVCRQLTEKKGYFALHADPLSLLVYDIQFLLCSSATPVADKAGYLETYPTMLALGDGQLTTGGYAPAFVADWFDERQNAGHIVSSNGLSFSPGYRRELLERIRKRT